jgi:hypothetical protein
MSSEIRLDHRGQECLVPQLYLSVVSHIYFYLYVFGSPEKLPKPVMARLPALSIAILAHVLLTTAQAPSPSCVVRLATPFHPESRPV